MSRKASNIIAPIALVLSFSAGCDDVDWPDPQYIDSVRTLGVRAEAPTLTPGASTELSIHCADGRRGTGQEPTCNVEVAWFAQCNNPDKNDPEKCFGRYTEWADSMASTLGETPTEAYPDGFGFGPTFSFSAPNDILSAELDAAGKTIRYGTSYVSFAVCAGQLVPVRGVSERLPVECRDRKTGKALDQRSFVVGVKTIYSYDLVASRNPVLLTPRFDGTEIPDSCSAPAECPTGFECSKEKQCLPVVQPCAGDEWGDCKEHCLTFDLALDSFSLFDVDGTRLDAPLKSVWLDYLTNAGALPDDDDPSFGLRAPTEAAGTKRTECIRWQPPRAPTEHAHLWAVVRDNRSGIAVWDQRIIVR